MAVAIEHTPTPWATEWPVFPAEIVGADGKGIGGTISHRGREIEIANAEFIVRAVNAHADLVAALRDMIALFDEINTFGDFQRAGHARVDAAQSALSKAEG